MVKDETTRFLNLSSLDNALRMLYDRCSRNPRVVEIPIEEACGRITAAAIFSPLSIPAAHLSAMDGIAVKSYCTIGATEQKPLLLNEFVRVNTGNMIPDGFDAVIMIEDVEEQGNGFLIRSSAHPWQHVRPVGEDIAESEMIIPKHTRIRPVDIGAMTGYGITLIPVLDLKVALIPTGSEVVPIGTVPQAGQVIDSNMHMAAALIKDTGARVTHFPIVPDERDQIRSSVTLALSDHDIVLISAGSSKGTKDYTSGIISELGEVFVHGVAIKPAKPVILGDVNGKPVIGMPGYPIACLTILREIVLPLLQWYGFKAPLLQKVRARLTSTLYSSIGTDEFVLTSVGKREEHWIAVPLSRGAGIQMSMVRANAYLKIPADTEGLESGAETDVYLTVPVQEAEQIALITGSHDPVLDYLADLVRDSDIRVASSHVGSMGGLLALKRGDTHLAPMHLLAEDGEYNIPYLKLYLPDEELVLICVAEREQGIVSRDNLGFDDLQNHTFINRQRGSGTRMLLDHMLSRSGISPDSITGYDKEVTTHLAVCLAIKSGDADLGMAVFSAANTFGLHFVPIGVERYELVTTRSLFENDKRIQAIVETIRSEQFRKILETLGGYKTGETGVIRSCGPSE